MAIEWLSEHEQRAWRAFHQLRTALPAHLARELNRDCSLSESEYAILVAVSEAPGGRIRSRDLCRALGWERSRLSHQIGRMEARGTVERAESVGDARGFDVVLTEQGGAVIASAAQLHLTSVRHCFIDLLTPEQLSALIEITETVTTHLTTEHGDQGEDTVG